MKIKLLLFFLIFPLFTNAQSYKAHMVFKDRLEINVGNGKLSIIPMLDKAIRIQWIKTRVEERELVFVNKPSVPYFKVKETPAQISLSTIAVTVTFNKATGKIAYSDKNGKTFLSEMPGSRKLDTSSIHGEACYIAEQSFDSPANEYLFGLGQFQDGQYNLKNISRKLIQVNSQISIPFLYSSRGFGILWHQYGLTEFNPADQVITLTKKDSASADKKEADVTTTSGTRRISQRQSLYTGKFTVKHDGEYSFMLDLGDMDNRHLVIIDDVPQIDQSNQWLPPAVGKLIKLKAGEHSVQVVCKATNTPKLSFKKAGNQTTFSSPNAQNLDYVVFYGSSADEVIKSYRNLSGNVPMLPKWAYGFWQCRERYTSGEHLVNTIEEFRRRKLPVDVIVQDWQYWGKYGWGVPKFDETHYPEPEKFIKKLHDLNAHFSLSVWENLDKRSEVAKPYIDKNLYIPNSPWIDIFNPETGKTHWNALNENLFKYGVDSWWMDATEPENDALAGKKTYYGLGDFYRLTYPLLVSKAIYNGQRATDSNKRVAILTRSAYPGQQRYGTINWSGDIGWDWDTYKRQIVAGLNYALTGMPYWTTDIGGFFRPGASQYSDPKYHDILTRWFQWGAFNPIFRIHGYQTETEPWKYGEQVEANMRTMLNLRYRLLPYIYSEGWQVSSSGSTLMRPLVMDFKNDQTAVGQAYEYMFGRSFLVAPVTEPGIKERSVYLPKDYKWFDFWTGKAYPGGQTVVAASPQDKIPLFVKSGSIIPMGKVIQYASQTPADTLEIRIYTGAYGNFTLYNDEGDNYNYEKGKSRQIGLHWNERNQSLTIDKAKGSYNGAPIQYVFNVVWIDDKNSSGLNKPKTVAYKGQKLTINRR
ncbi:glycoside hydrolase family 31 protein [Mucilaginibacter terrae]|uniref:Alpha-D-xyloside xylohydrolase n=1 Tax=Mucilaginibacter terrae TaxID=1955052 RepID=A0ABU3GSQ4_9SPHI|nr:TIM-barrel domain-containing protein [Mucilaginibacter terrae]MDT3402007.1 alpha-D-xyloside xylohydrolase [Mucilaginibacter terrae]